MSLAVRRKKGCLKIKTLAILRSRNPVGQTAQAVDAGLKVVESLGGITDRVFLPKQTLNHCRQCDDDGWGLCKKERRRRPISKHKWYIHLAFVLMFGLLHGTSFAQTPAPYLIQAQSKNCQHRLHPQPNKGPFSVFLFCDDALGANIGVILTEPGGGPGAMKLTGDMVWDKWYTNDRFWQDKLWATDVVNFLWSQSLRHLYVATSGIYGDGGFFKLDLKERSSSRQLPDPSAKYLHRLETGYLTKIEKVDIENNLITVGIYIYDETLILVAQEEIPFE